MTLKGVNEFLKKKCPNYSVVAEIGDFKGQRVALDAGLHMVKFSSVIHKNLLYKLKSPTEDYTRHEFQMNLCCAFLTFVMGWLKRGVNVITIFDGSPREEKLAEIATRKEGRVSIREKIAIEMERYMNLNPLDIRKSDDDALLKIRCQDHRMGKEDYQAVQDMLRRLGLPVFIAEHDAEKLCASLSREGLVVAVLSNDTDNYALGTQLTISEHDFKNDQLKIADLEIILNYFADEFSVDVNDVFPMFVDFCIMCGCDFNNNIKGIGPVGVLKLLKNHKTIEGVESEKDISCYNYESCRNIFEYTESGIFDDQLEINWEMYDANLATTLESFASYGLTNVASLVNKADLTKKCKIHSNGI